MKKEDRFKQILEVLKINQISNVQNLSNRLNVSHMTIRRDIKELVSRNMLRVQHGSVIINPEASSESEKKTYSLDLAESVNIEQKRRIGMLAASYIEPNDTLIIDYGSTAEYFAKNIPADIPLTILSYALNVINVITCKDNCKLIFTGGEFHRSTLSFDSHEGIEVIKSFRANKAFVTAAGIDSKFGATCANYYERPTKKALLLSSRKKILLADSSKFGEIGAIHFADMADFDEIITDSGISADYREIINSLGIKLRIA